MTSHKAIMISFGFTQRNPGVLGYINLEEKLILKIHNNPLHHNAVVYKLYYVDYDNPGKHKILQEDVTIDELKSFLTVYFRKKKIKTFLNEN